MKRFTDLKAELLIARKEKRKIVSNLLSTILGEVELELKRNGGSEDEVLLKTATKFAKNLETSLEARTTAIAMNELVLVKEYLPSKLSNGEIRTAVINVVKEHGKDMRTIMPILKSIPGIDMKIASNIVKEL
jgi:uncharacterized protein YqeY